MTMKEEIKLQDKSIRNLPVVLWARIKSKCAKKEMTITEGIIEAATDWLGKD